MSNTSKIGSIAQMHCKLKFMEKGYVVLEPEEEGTIFDFVILKDNIFQKVQCKNGVIRNGCIRFNTSQVKTAAGKYVSTKRYTSEEIDLFSIYVPETNNIYCMSINKCMNKSKQLLRIDIPKNNQKKLIDYAIDYQL